MSKRFRSVSVIFGETTATPLAKLFEDKKLTLINDYKTSLESNSTWLDAIHSADKNNLYLERLMNIETIIKSISKREIVQLANKHFDGIYFSDIQLISE